MATETVTMDDASLFEAATEAPPTGDKPATPAAEETAPVATPEPSEGSQPRDEHGRFASKVETPAEQPTEHSAQQPADHIPSWRLREESEARRAAEQRMAQYEAHARQLEARLRQLTEKPQEPIDPFADPQRFRDEGIQQHIVPLQRQVMETREYFSRELAVAKHGEEAVKQAYDWLAQGMGAGDPHIGQLFQRVMGTQDPYGELLKVHKRETVASDPEAWMRQQLAERAKDPVKRQELLQLLSGGEQQPGQSAPRNVVHLPPSLNRAGGGGSVPQPNGGMDDASLFAFATGKT